MTRRRTVRRSQTLSPFGVGAIYDILGESFVAADISRWSPSAERIRMDRLAASLDGIQDFRLAPAAPEEFYKSHGPGLPFQRFPRWLFCQKCRRMVKWNTGMEPDAGERGPECFTCGKRAGLVPMRFVMVCEGGHLDDVDWVRWAHSGDRANVCRETRKLRFESDPQRGGGLRSLSVKCSTCGSSRDFDRLAAKDVMKTIGARCRGLQPWQALEAAQECSRTPQVVQRGASNVHFADVRSAIDIPPWSDYDPASDDMIKLNQNTSFAALVTDLAEHDGQVGPLAQMLAKSVASTHSVEINEVLRHAIAQATGKAPDMPKLGEDDLVAQEWQAFMHPAGRDVHPRSTFVAREVPFNPSGDLNLEKLHALVGTTVVAEKLREVRALVGFSRLSPAEDEASTRPDLGKGLPWLPALEVFGEGLFVSLDEQRVAAWESDEGVIERVGRMRRNADNSSLAGWLAERATPRFVLVHTLAHLFIRQLTFECGYSSASLRERLYVGDGGDPMAGFLVYTASGDSEGTLGGLARQGEPPRLAGSLVAALSRSTWCSTDPICIESAGQGMGALNRGACHGCALLAETSCTHVNSLLDRGVIVGTPEKPSLGYFSELLDDLAGGWT